MKQENFDAVAPWEDNMGTAVRADWTRNISREAAETFQRVWREESGDATYTVHRNCGACILDVLQRVGRLYFAHKEQQAAETSKPKRNDYRRKNGNYANKDK